MMSAHDRDATATLLRWCAEHDICIDPRLSVVPDDEHGGLRVLNNSASQIDSRTTGESRPCARVVRFPTLTPISTFCNLCPLTACSRTVPGCCRLANAMAQTVATIPKAAVLSVRVCAFADAIPIIPYGHGARLALSLALYGEL